MIVVAYCVVAIESAGRQLPLAFLERVKDEFSKKYGGGKAATASANSLNREFGYSILQPIFYDEYICTCFTKSNRQIYIIDK